MKKKKVVYLGIILSCLLISCNNTDHPNRAYFSYKGKYDKITTIIPIKFGGLTINMMLDTGGTGGYFEIDSAFAALNPSTEWSAKPDYVCFVNDFSPWASEENDSKIQNQYSWYNKPITPMIGETMISYDSFWVKEKMIRVDADGFMGLPKNDSTHIWEFNFDLNYLEIHKVESFKMPKNTYVFPLMIKEGWPFVQFPLSAKSDNGEVLILNDAYLIDTGATQDFMVFPSEEEVEFFTKTGNGMLIATMHGSYRTRFTINAKSFEDHNLEDMRIYLDENNHLLREKNIKGVLGMNFLKRFNVFFDFNAKQIGFQPVREFKRVVDPLIRKYYYSTHKTSDKKEIVLNIADTPNNPYKEAGLKVGDEIVTINGFEPKAVNHVITEEIEKTNVRELDILRNGNMFKITVVLDEKDIKGE